MVGEEDGMVINLSLLSMSLNTFLFSCYGHQEHSDYVSCNEMPSSMIPVNSYDRVKEEEGGMTINWKEFTRVIQLNLWDL